MTALVVAATAAGADTKDPPRQVLSCEQAFTEKAKNPPYAYDIHADTVNHALPEYLRPNDTDANWLAFVANERNPLRSAEVGSQHHVDEAALARQQAAYAHVLPASIHSGLPIQARSSSQGSRLVNSYHQSVNWFADEKCELWLDRNPGFEAGGLAAGRLLRRHQPGLVVVACCVIERVA